jgi:hypothetical protein
MQAAFLAGLRQEMFDHMQVLSIGFFQSGRGRRRAVEFGIAATDDDESDYPFPFHPLESGEAALKEFFGYQLEGVIDPTLLKPESIPLVKYKHSRSRWKL